MYALSNLVGFLHEWGIEKRCALKVSEHICMLVWVIYWGSWVNEEGW